jgi:hypothetical protein
MSKEFKNTPKANLKSTLFFNKELFEDLVEVVGTLGIPIGSNPRLLNLANKISQFVEKECPDGCLS